MGAGDSSSELFLLLHLALWDPISSGSTGINSCVELPPSPIGDCSSWGISPKAGGVGSVGCCWEGCRVTRVSPGLRCSYISWRWGCWVAVRHRSPIFLGKNDNKIVKEEQSVKDRETTQSAHVAWQWCSTPLNPQLLPGTAWLVWCLGWGLRLVPLVPKNQRSESLQTLRIKSFLGWRESSNLYSICLTKYHLSPSTSFSFSPNYPSQHLQLWWNQVLRLNVNVLHTRESSKLYSYLLIGARIPTHNNTTYYLTPAWAESSSNSSRQRAILPDDRPFQWPSARFRAPGHLPSFTALKQTV